MFSFDWYRNPRPDTDSVWLSSCLISQGVGIPGCHQSVISTVKLACDQIPYQGPQQSKVEKGEVPGQAKAKDHC
jgi:hypothetical protein